MNYLTGSTVLIIAYRRMAEIERILQVCKDNNVNKIYFALDGPKDGNTNGEIDNKVIREIVTNFQKNYSGEMKTLFRDQNVGCAASILSACDWAFKNEEYVIVLEDDCIPSPDFFKFAQESIKVLDSDYNIWLACGTQFVPREILNDSWSISSYALIWGWVTSQAKWQEISSAIRSGNPIPKHTCISPWERIYWNHGSRRAYSGWVDVWDTILLQQMIANNKFAILPNEPLVTNVGNDSIATHTFESSPWLHLNVGIFNAPQSPPRVSISADKWLRSKFYKVTIGHLVTTKITYLRDFINKRNTPLPPLYERWNFANLMRKKSELSN